MHGATSTILYFEYVNPVLEHISINYISVSSKVLLKREWRFVCLVFKEKDATLKFFVHSIQTILKQSTYSFRPCIICWLHLNQVFNAMSFITIYVYCIF